jgi:putative salt-induced outer membrane protein YdiY
LLCESYIRKVKIYTIINSTLLIKKDIKEPDMKTFFRKMPIILSVIVILTCDYSMADEVFLKNGDRISGKVLNMKDNKLFIETSYSGEIGIIWNEIISLRADDEISVLLNDDTMINGSTREAENGVMRLGTGKIAEKMSFSLADVKAINPEPPAEEPAVKMKTRLNLGITSSRGNTEKDTQHFDGEFIARTEKNRYTIGGEVNRSEDSGNRTEDNSLVYFKYDHFVSEKWFYYSNTLFEKDKFKDLKLRSVSGLGSGYQVFETPVTNLSLEAGINYNNDDYETALDESYSSGRWSINYDRYFYDKAFQLFHFHEGFVSIEDTDDIFIKSRTGIRIPLFKNINASFQYNVDWDKTPSPGREETDRTFIFSLGYQIEQ